ncbi:hypothetical protein KA478_02620 [Patescibacteria group bacterium]|nr:hypothetical protein [Patescibacteria group bacterium]
MNELHEEHTVPQRSMHIGQTSHKLVQLFMDPSHMEFFGDIFAHRGTLKELQNIIREHKDFALYTFHHNHQRVDKKQLYEALTQAGIIPGGAKRMTLDLRYNLMSIESVQAVQDFMSLIIDLDALYVRLDVLQDDEDMSINGAPFPKLTAAEKGALKRAIFEHIAFLRKEILFYMMPDGTGHNEPFAMIETKSKEALVEEITELYNLTEDYVVA